MKITKIDSLDKLKKLKVGDMIVVKWSDYFIKHTMKSLKKKAYNIEEILHYNKEIICNRKYNHYFNYEMYIGGESAAEEVFFIED